MKHQPSLKNSPVKAPAERVVKDIRRQTRRHFSAEDNIRIVLDGLRGEDSQSRQRQIATDRLHRLHRGRYGSPRIHAALREEGIVASPGRVACLMRRHGLRALAGRKFKSCTTDSHLELGGLTLHTPSAGKLRFASQYTSFPRRRLQCAN